MMSEKMGPIISTNGLVFCVDAANPQSIVSGQTIWKDLTFNTTGGTLTNGVIFTGTGVSSGLSYDGTDDYISNINGVSTTNQISVNAWIRPRSVNNFQHIVDASNNTWHLAILNTNNVYSTSNITTSSDYTINNGYLNSYTQVSARDLDLSPHTTGVQDLAEENLAKLKTAFLTNNFLN